MKVDPLSMGEGASCGALAPGMGMAQLTRILAVEEDPAFRGILLDLLRPVAATRLAAAADLAEGLELLGREEWDAMVLGLNLGGQYGSGAVEEIRCLTPTLPLLVLPPSVDSKVALECLRLGADDILCKSNLSEDELYRSLLYAQASAASRDR